MKRLLLIDDDALVIRSYRDRLSAHGFQVNTVASGTAAIAFLRSAVPDLVVLDLMIPDLSGVEVLKFIRSQPKTASVPVVVLTNEYLNELGRQAAKIGIEKAFLKAKCSPSVLMAGIDEIFLSKQAPAAPDSAPESADAPAAAPLVEPEPPAKPLPRPAVPSPRPGSSGSSPATRSEPAHFQDEPTAELLNQVAAIGAELRKGFQALARAPQDEIKQGDLLRDLFRRAHFLVVAAGRLDFSHLRQTAAGFEALLFVLIQQPSRLNASVVRTIANLVDFVEVLIRDAGKWRGGEGLSARVLVVDDDPLSNRSVVSALKQAHLDPHSTEDPIVAWQWANERQFDLVLLDVEMPVLNGFVLCERLRALPGYARTPIIFVTLHGEFETRAKSSLSGGNDLISKPILPMELAAKVVMHLVKSQLPG